MPILGEMSSVHGMFRELEEEVYLPKDEYERVMRLHAAYPIPAVKFGLIKPICTDEIEVREEVITPLPDDFTTPPRGARGKVKASNRATATPSPCLWDVGNVVELTPDIIKITVSVSELRDRIKNISANN
ncbi:uncharacterized protein LOC134826246 [Bolinopsis microptera]|uniref:uncharacterized protein LOC134826246 n=1 Tax=Bolinopsis microptera TaxID=2820187 RepID=UPI00307A0FC9